MNFNTSKDGDPPLSEEVDLLIQRFLDEDLDANGFEELQSALKKDSAARARYFTATESAVLLRELSFDSSLDKEDFPPAQKPTLLKFRPKAFLPISYASAAAIIFLTGYFLLTQPPVGANIITSSAPTWISAPLPDGASLRTGTQLQLASGSVEIAFKSGATTQLIGPALFEIDSNNSATLHYGQTLSVAEGESSNGFTIETHNGSYVDYGTEFVTHAAADGASQMFVLKGSVDARSEGFGTQRLTKGSGIGFESGETPVMIQIESGTEEPTFRFPSIPPPTSEDFASKNDIMVDTATAEMSEYGNAGLALKSAPATVLINGRAQSNEDDISESVFFWGGASGYFVFDLGGVVPISGIHTYSWHKSNLHPGITMRAVQRYTVWGAKEVRPVGLPIESRPQGWTRIARVDTDSFFHVAEDAERPSQQACRITPAGDTMGEFRYLIFEVKPTSGPVGKMPRHTFFSEIDVFTQ